MIFLICDIDDAARAGALVDSCRFVVLEVARRALGSVLDVGKRRRRVRGPLHGRIHISTGPQPAVGLEHKSPKFWIQSSPESPKNRRMRSK